MDGCTKVKEGKPDSRTYQIKETKNGGNIPYLGHIRKTSLNPVMMIAPLRQPVTWPSGVHHLKYIENFQLTPGLQLYSVHIVLMACLRAVC